MAIIDGNYKYFNFDSIKENLLNVFSIYYGEKYRPFIESKFNKCGIDFFHTFDYVRKHYEKIIIKYENEIMENFYRKSNLDRTPSIDEWLKFTTINNKLSDNKLKELFSIYVCGRYYEHDEYDESFRQEFIKDFNYENLDNEEFYSQLIELKDLYKASVQEVYKNNPCDVFKDYHRENRNIVYNSQELLKFCSEQELVKFSAKDLFKIVGKNLTEVELATMDCYGRIFFENLTVPGLIESFDSNCEKIIQDEDIYNATYIRLSRIRYMYLSGAKLKYIKEEDLFSSNIEESEDYIDIVNKEYQYQVENNSQYFVSTEDAYRIENMRKGLMNKRFKKLKCYPQGEFFDYETDRMTRFNYFHVIKELNNDLYENESRIYMNADDNEDDKNNKWFLIALIHELNHNLGASFIKQVNEYKYFRNNGLTSTKVFANKENKVFGRFEAEQNTMSEEFVNQKQSEEMYEIYIQLYDLPKFLDIEKEGNEYTSLYNDFEPILGDFYREFRDELKKSKVHDISLYDYLDFPESKNEIMCNFITIADELSECGEASEFYEMFDENIRQELIEEMLQLRQFLTYGVMNDLFNPSDLLNFRETEIGLKDKIKFQLILRKIFSTMKKVGIKKDVFRNNIKYNIKNKVGTILKTKMNGAIDYSKMWELNLILEQYREMLNKYGIRGVFNIKDREELMCVMKNFLNEEDFEFFKFLMERKDYITNLMVRDKERFNQDEIDFSTQN